MKILNRYILSEWWFAFIIAMLANAGLLIIEDVYKNASDFIQAGISASQLASYYFWLVIRILPIIIPVSFFLSLLFSLGKLHKNNELLAIRAIGANIFQITAPLWIVSCLLAILEVVLNLSISSIASQNTQNFCARVKNMSVNKNVAFKNEKDNRLWFFGTFCKEESIGTNVMIYFYDSAGNETERFLAEKAEYKNGQWFFQNIVRTLFDASTKYPTHIDRFESKNFCFDETPDLFFSLKKRVKYLSLPELRNILTFSNGKKDYFAYRVQYYRSMISSLSCIIILFITIPFATVGVRRSPMTGVAKACGVLFLFYIISNIFSIFGSHCFVPVFVTVLAPYIIVLMFSYILYRKCV